MAKADKRYGFDVIPDLRLEMELDPSHWACLCNTTGHVVTRREAEEGYRLSRLSALGEEMTGRARHELCMVSEVEGTKENYVKFELVYLWGDELMWGEWYSTVGYESGGEVGMSSGCLKVQNNHTTWNTICNNYKLHSFVLINLMLTMPTFKMGQLRYVGLHDLLVVRRQSCPTLCDPMDYSLPGPSVHGIL